MPLPTILRDSLRIPLVCAPMFLISGPQLVVAACRAGNVGAFPSINARTPKLLNSWIEEIKASLPRLNRQTGFATPPFAVNLLVHSTKSRLADDLDVCLENSVSFYVTSAGDPGRIVERAHSNSVRGISLSTWPGKVHNTFTLGLLPSGTGGFDDSPTPYILG